MSVEIFQQLTDNYKHMQFPFDYHAISVIAHLVGVVIGMGGAFASDIIFLTSIKDRKLTKTEMRFINLGSKMVWFGIAIIIISGLFLFAENPARYAGSSKFLAKMSIVGIIVLNGMLFRYNHIPWLNRHIGKKLSISSSRSREGSALMISGVISIISWVSALALGTIKRISYSYGEIMLTYLLILLLALGIALFLRKKIFSISL